MKTGKSMRQYLYAAFLATFLLGLAAPTAAFADDGAPAEIAEEPAAEAAQETDEAAAEPAISAEEPAAEETLPEEMSDVMQAIPEGTDLVVLDEAGEELSLACEQALETMAESDPIWCPAGVMPGGAGCTAAVATLTELFPLLAGKSGAGTIYFTTSYNTNDVVLDQVVNKNLFNLTNLTLQGGWNGSTVNPSILDGDGNPERTEFRVPIKINWNFDVTLHDLFVQPGWDYRMGNAITITQNNPEADVTLDHVEGHIAEKGVMISGGHDVTISDSNFGGNYGRGIDVRSVNGTFTLRDSSSSGSSDSGLALQTIKNVIIDSAVISGNNLNRYNASLGHFSNIVYDAENITITDSVFNSNNWWGLVIQYGEYYLWEFDTTRTNTLDTLTINGSEFKGNSWDGLLVNGWYQEGGEDHYAGTVDINSHEGQRSVFSENVEFEGLEISGIDLLDINGADFNDNVRGLYARQVDTIKVADASFNENSDSGALINGVTDADFNGTAAKPIRFNDNIQYGAVINNEEWMEVPGFSATVNLDHVFAENNGHIGFSLTEFSGVTVDQCGFYQNDHHGMILQSWLPGNVSVKNSYFDNNTSGYGAFLSLAEAGDVLFENNSAKENGIGVHISTRDNVSYLCSPTENNLEIDLEILADGILRLKGVDPEDEDYYENSYFFPGEDFIYLGVCAAGTCGAVSGGTVVAAGGRTVQVVGGEQVNLGCDVPWTALQLPNGDKATFNGMCGAGLNATLEEVSQGELPGLLPAGMTYGKSLTTAIAGAGSELPSGSQTITFTVPDDLQGSDLSIMFWDADAGAWVEIAQDKVVFNADGSVSVTVTFTGTFVLAAG